MKCIWTCDTQSCTVVLGLSLKDTCPHQNTLPISSLPGVNFTVFHLRDLSPFLIRLTRAFTFHHYFIFSFLFPFHTLFTISLAFLHTTMMQMNVMRLITLIHISPISLELQSCHKSQNLPTIPTNSQKFAYQ